MHYMENEYSEIDTLKSLKKSMYSVIQVLEEKSVLPENGIDRQAGLKLIEKILDNFYMYTTLQLLKEKCYTGLFDV